MKTRILKISLALVTLALLLPGCLDIWITTTVNMDGSLGKSLTFQGDSTEIADVSFACMRQDGWKRDWTKPEKDKWKLVMTREFPSVDALNASMNPDDTSRLTLRTKSTLHRKFRWFFTRFVYEETALMANPYPWIKVNQFLSDEEIRLICLNETARKADPAFDSIRYKDTEKRFEEYLFRSMYEDFHRQLLSIIRSDKSLTITVDQVDARKEQIWHYLVDSLNGDQNDAILKGIFHVVGHPDLETVRMKYLDRFDGFQQRLKFYESCSDDNYKFAIRMPGLMVQTNSTAIEGAQAGWDLTYYDFFFHDYRMTAESRTVNTWAFIVAGLVVLAALALGIMAIRRKR